MTKKFYIFLLLILGCSPQVQQPVKAEDSDTQVNKEEKSDLYLMCTKDSAQIVEVITMDNDDKIDIVRTMSGDKFVVIESEYAWYNMSKAFTDDIRDLPIKRGDTGD